MQIIYDHVIMWLADDPLIVLTGIYVSNPKSCHHACIYIPVYSCRNIYRANYIRKISPSRITVHTDVQPGPPSARLASLPVVEAF